MKGKQYKECPLCHAHLDFGERCDCQEQRERQRETMEKQFQKDPRTGQMMMVWGRKEREKVV